MRLAFLLVLAAVAAHATDLAWEELSGQRSVIKLEDGTRIQLQEFPGASKFAALQHLWETVEVVVECPEHKDFSVYTGPSIEAVRAAYGDKQSAWCGWEHAVSGGHKCRTSISPFGPTVVAVAKPRGWFDFGAGGRDADHACTLTRRAALSMPRLLASVVGSYLFWQAPTLSTSTPFRLTGGTLGFVLFSALLLLFILYRQVPQSAKKGFLLGSFLFSGTTVAAMRYFLGTWLPSWSLVLRSPVVLAYLVLSGLSGMGLTYYYNNPENTKVNTMLSVALHLLGLSLAAVGPSLPEASALWVAALLGARAWPIVSRHRTVGALLRSVKRAAQEAAEEVPPAGPPAQQQQRQPAAAAAAAAGKQQGWGFRAGKGEGAGAVTPVLATARGGPAGDYVAAVEATPVATPAPAVPQQPELSPLVQRGLVLNEETGHLIHIGKATYNRLVASGYQVDRSKGVITPPPASLAASPSPPRGSGRGAARRRKAA